MRQNIEKLLGQIKSVVVAAMEESIAVIRAEASSFVREQKRYYDGKGSDVVTSADKAAQAVYQKHFEVGLPGFGLIGEEGLSAPCALPDENIYITVDPLDGTKAFARYRAVGVGTMVGVVRQDRVIAGFVGDVNSGDIWGFAPGHLPSRLRFGTEVTLCPKAEELRQSYVLLNDSPAILPKCLHPLLKPAHRGGLLKDVEVEHGSYGLLASRLWNNEAVAAVFGPGWSTPWDETPVLGLCQELGFRRYWVDEGRGVILPEPRELQLAQKPYRVRQWSILTQPAAAEQIVAWLAK